MPLRQAPVAQLVEQRTFNPWVQGSIPCGRTKLFKPGLVPGLNNFESLGSNPGGLAREGSERGLSVRPRQWFSEAVLRKPLLVRSTADPLRAYNEESER